MSLDLVRTMVDEVLKSTDAGEISGYATTWTYQGDGVRFTPGSFKKTIAERIGKIPLLIRHEKGQGSVLETVGFVVKAEEDEKGLYVTAKFLDTELAQAVRQQALSGGIQAMSISARVIKFVENNDIAVCSEAAVREVTLTNFPADVEAEVIAVRSQPTAQVTALKPSCDTLDDQTRRNARIRFLQLKRD